MRRREFISLLGGTAVTWPLSGQAQQSALPVVGWMSSSTDSTNGHLVAAFKRGLSETGYAEGQTFQLNIVGQRVTTIGSRRSPQSW